MPLFKLRIWDIGSFLHFSHTCFEILSWNFVYDFVFTIPLMKFECRQFASIFVGVMPLLELRILEIHFSTLFSHMLLHIELKFCIWLSLSCNELQIKFEWHQLSSTFVLVTPLLELRILEIHSFPHFSVICFEILSWNFEYDFHTMNFRSSLIVVNLRQFLKEHCLFGT